MPIKWVYLVSLFIIAAGCFYLLYDRVENFFLFFPQTSFDSSPADLRLNYKDVYFRTEDGERLHGWFFSLDEESPVILFCHGNAGNISHRLDNVRLLLQEGFRVFIFDYRGYGKSGGSPSERGIYRDGRAAWEYLVRVEKVPAGEIVLFGRSLGAAVALEVALRKEVRAVILESAFTSTRDMAGKMGPFALLSPLLPAHYNNLEKIGGLQVPKLIVHGDSDKIVPFSMGERLFKTAKAPKFFLPLQGAGHNDTYLVGGEGYFQTLASFARRSRL